MQANCGGAAGAIGGKGGKTSAGEVGIEVDPPPDWKRASEVLRNSQGSKSGAAAAMVIDPASGTSGGVDGRWAGWDEDRVGNGGRGDTCEGPEAMASGAWLLLRLCGETDCGEEENGKGGKGGSGPSDDTVVDRTGEGDGTVPAVPKSKRCMDSCWTRSRCGL